MRDFLIINDFINDPEQRQYRKTFRLANVFGWVGLPFLALGYWAYWGGRFRL
jgi:hypothetical protein